MKRMMIPVIILAWILLLTCSALAEGATQQIVIGQSFFFGSYEQDNHTENGPEPIEWLVLTTDNNRALLISKYALDCQPFNTEKKDITWQNSSIRNWLASTFFPAAFSTDEQNAVLQTAVINDRGEGNAEWSTNGGKETLDKVFLLSIHEVGVYFHGDNSFKTTGTEYARAQGAKFLGLTTIGVGETDWWLRSPGSKQSDAAFVGTLVHAISSKSVSDKIGVRPAIWYDLSADQSLFPYAVYESAAAAAAAGDYASAAEGYESLGAYRNCKELALETRYAQANEAASNGQYAAAAMLYESLGSYKESQTKLRDARYHQAITAEKSGDYDKAIELFTLVGQYSDSMEHLKSCFQTRGISIHYLSAKAVNTGLDNGYLNSNMIIGGDAHYGWVLGEFLVTGFTRKTTDDAGNPVFLKTLGDDVTLWFELEQDITQLNGSSSLSINEDTNGYNAYFGVQKTNFGHGTLIVRHTDYQNAVGKPQIYTNYLAATATSGANTRIVFHEEGDYEIALNYEIKNTNASPIGGVIANFTDYSITCKFSVRNGNCMVYPFDVVTGTELSNSSVTPNGFYLDLAKSRYLDINVKRSIMTEGVSGGFVEDDRYNRPAKDGERYTAEGIYTITVSNRYTGETTTKTLFVGDDDLLQRYIGNGFAADSLN